MQRLSTIIPSTVFTESCPFVNFDHPSVNPTVKSFTQKDFEIIFTKSGSNKSLIRQCAQNKYHYTIYIFMELCPFVNFVNFNTFEILFFETWYKYKALSDNDSTNSFHVIMRPHPS